MGFTDWMIDRVETRTGEDMAYVRDIAAASGGGLLKLLARDRRGLNGA